MDASIPSLPPVRNEWMQSAATTGNTPLNPFTTTNPVMNYSFNTPLQPITVNATPKQNQIGGQGNWNPFQENTMPSTSQTRQDWKGFDPFA
jgi:hypothetical protein